MGLPSVITTDQGKEFPNLLNAELMTVFGIKHRLTTCYHPQSNGLDERFNQMLVNALTKYAQDDHAARDSNLKETVYAYNTAIQDSSKHTPFEAMFGRTAKLPVDFNVMGDYNVTQQLQEYFDSDEPDHGERAAKRQKLNEAVKQNIEMAQQKQKMYYDTKHGAWDKHRPKFLHPRKPKNIRLYCNCLMPETWSDMILCDSCDQWFHMQCVGLKAPPALEEQWICNDCA